MGLYHGILFDKSLYICNFDPKTVDLKVYIFNPKLVHLVTASASGLANLCFGSVTSRGVSICVMGIPCVHLYPYVLIHLPWFRNRALTLTDNSGQTDMFLGQHKCPIAPPRRTYQLLSIKIVDKCDC